MYVQSYDTHSFLIHTIKKEISRTRVQSDAIQYNTIQTELLDQVILMHIVNETLIVWFILISVTVVLKRMMDIIT